MRRKSPRMAMAVALSAGTVLFGTVLAQAQDRPGQDRDYTTQDRQIQNQDRERTPGTSQLSQEMRNLQALEGYWRVSVEFLGQNTGAPDRGVGSQQGNQPPDRPGQQGQPAGGTQVGGQGQLEGFATRRWVLEQSLLHEELRITSVGTGTPARFRENQPDRPMVDQQSKQQIEQNVAKELQDAGVSQAEAQQAAQEFCARLDPQMSEQAIQQQLMLLLVRHGVDANEAREKASEMAKEIKQTSQSSQSGQHGQQQGQPSQANQQQIQQTLEMTLRTAMDPEQAKQKAEQLSREITSNNLSGDQLKARIKQALVDAGANETTAEQQSSTLATRIDAINRQGRGQGAGGQGIGGQGQTPTGTPTSLQQLQDFQGMGLFAYDKESRRYQHVWSDTMHGGLSVSTGEYNASNKTFEFDKVELKSGASRSPNAPDINRPGETGQNQPPRDRGTGAMQSKDDASFTLRVHDENRHVIEMTAVEDGQPVRYRITYTRAGAATAPGEIDRTRDRDTEIDRQREGEAEERGGGDRAAVEMRIDQMIRASLLRVGATTDDLDTHVRELREDIMENHQEGDLAEDIVENITDAFEDAGVDETRARTEAVRLAAEIRRLLGNG